VDSSALVLALATASEQLVVAHVVHDMRGIEEALGDRDAARALADRVGLTFVEASITTREATGNREAIARRRRYDALARLATEQGCVAIATAHHAEDQLETVLMRLMRGAGMRGMGGIAPERALEGVRVVRPMLGVGREVAVRVCRMAGWAWREDATNLDTRLLRAMLRREVVPALRGRSENVSRRAVEFGQMAREAAWIARERAARILSGAKESGGDVTLARSDLKGEPTIVVGELLHAVRDRLCGERGKDRMRWASVERVQKIVGDGGEHRRVVRVAGLEIVVDARRVVVRSTEGAE
jgi:tRNA(Ile)-lysidine synthase